MKCKISLSSIILLFVSTIMFANNSSKVEMLYFKVNLPCCQARACNNLENITKTIIENNFDKKDVIFTTIKLSDEQNKTLVTKYNAKSQTVILENKKKKKSIDVSDIVKKFAISNDQAQYEKELKQKIKQIIK